MEKERLAILQAEIKAQIQEIEGIEGHQMLAEKIDRVEVRLDQRMDGLEKKICEVHAGLSKEIKGVAVNLEEHRADTEVHKKIYKVKEE